MNVGFIGLGQMGGAMAANLLKGGHKVKGFDIAQPALDRLKSNGGTPCSSMEEAATDVDVVFTMLPNSSYVESAVNDHLLKVMRKGSIFVDSSTILPTTTVRVGEILKKNGIRMVDAPVGRTSDDANKGTLLFMVGGESADIDEIRPCLNCMGDTVLHCGKLGAGIATKILNNYMTVTLNVLTAETLVLGNHLGLDQDKLLDALRGTPAGRSHINTTYPAKVLKGDVSPAFMLDLANKDLGLALEVAANFNVPFFTGAAARQAYSLARGQGRGREDWTAMYLAIEEMSKQQPAK